MIHIGTDSLPASITCTSSTAAACGATLAPGDKLVEAALCSDCDDCRAVVNIGPMSQKGCDYHETPKYTPEPMKNIESLEEIRRRKDGL